MAYGVAYFDCSCFKTATAHTLTVVFNADRDQVVNDNVYSVH